MRWIYVRVTASQQEAIEIREKRVELTTPSYRRNKNGQRSGCLDDGGNIFFPYRVIPVRINHFAAGDDADQRLQFGVWHRMYRIAEEGRLYERQYPCAWTCVEPLISAGPAPSLGGR